MRLPEQVAARIRAMLGRRKDFKIDLRSPYEELERAQQERLMRMLIYTAGGITLVHVIPYASAAINHSAWQGLVVNILQIPMFVLAFLAHSLLRRGRLQAAGHILFPYLLFIIAIDGVMGDMMGIVAPAYISIIVTAGVILGTSGILATAAMSFVLWLAAVIIAGTGAIPPAPLPQWLTDAVLFGVIVVCLIWTAFLNHGATARMRRLLTEANYHLIEANRQLQEANSLKSRFVARVSHDLRTPLSSILLSAGIIRQNLYGPLTPKQEEVLDRILNSTKHLEAIINDILDISKLEAGQLDLVEEAFEVDSLVKAVQATVEQTARDKGLAFPISLAPSMPACILGDKRRLTQILINLADNAVKFTSQGEVSTLIEPVEDDRWRMVVQDTGRGIHEEDLEVIFEEFRQANRAPTSAGGGAGLGLAITRHLVELMEGEIQVKSKLGKGSTFQVILPLKMPNPNQLPGQKETIHPNPS